MKYTSEKFDKLYLTYTRNYQAQAILSGSSNMSNMLSREDFARVYIEIKEQSGTLNIMQKIIRRHINTRKYD